MKYWGKCWTVHTCHSVNPCELLTVHFWMTGNRTANSSLSSCDTALLTTAYQDLMTVPLLISRRKGKQRWQQHVFLHPFLSPSLTLPRANTCFPPLGDTNFYVGILSNHVQNAAITWVIVWILHGLLCNIHLLLTGLQLNSCFYQPQSKHNLLAFISWDLVGCAS